MEKHCSLSGKSTQRITAEALRVINSTDKKPKFWEKLWKRIQGLRNTLWRESEKEKKEKDFLLHTLKDATWREVQAEVDKYTIFIAVECKFPWFWKTLYTEINKMEHVSISVAQLQDLSLQYNKDLIKPLTTFLNIEKPNDQDKQKLLNDCIKPYKERSEETAKQLEQDDRTEKMQIRAILEDLYKGERNPGMNNVPCLRYSLDKVWLNNREDIKYFALKNWYKPEEINKILNNYEKFLQEKDRAEKRNTFKEEVIAFHYLWDDKQESIPQSIQKVMKDPNRKKIATQCGYSKEQIQKIEGNYNRLMREKEIAENKNQFRTEVIAFNHLLKDNVKDLPNLVKEGMKNPNREKIATQCGYSEKQIQKIKENYNRLTQKK